MNKANPKLIGAFVLGAIGLLMAAMILFGKGDVFRSKSLVIMYFPGSVQGLRAGSAITFRGVTVGAVREIDFQYNTDTRDILIPVYAEIEGGNFNLIGSQQPPAPIIGKGEERLRYFVDQGLMAQLSLPNFVTNQVNVTIDFYPNQKPKFVKAEPNKTPIEIPTIPSTIQEVSATLQGLFKKLSQLPLDEFIADSRAVLQGSSRLVNDPKLTAIIANLNDMLLEARNIMKTVDSKLTPILANAENVSASAKQTMTEANARLAEARTTIRELNTVLAQASQLMSTSQGLIEPGSPVTFEMLTVLREVSATARSARSLIDTIERNPNAFLVGRQPSRGP